MGCVAVNGHTVRYADVLLVSIQCIIGASVKASSVNLSGSLRAMKYNESVNREEEKCLYSRQWIVT